MLLALFTRLSQALGASVPLALVASLVWGILSIVLSPCHLASIPLIVGFINGQGKISTKRAFLLAALFASGIIITIALIGLVTGLAGRMLGDVGPYGSYFVAAVFFLVGLHLLDIIALPFFGNALQPSYTKKGAGAAFMLGLLFGVALGPCTFAFMAPMLGVAFSVAATALPFAVALVLAYAVGHASVIVLAGTFTEVVQGYLNWNERSKGAVVLKRACGVLVIIAGIYMLFNAR